MTPANGRIFASLALWIDRVPREGPQQMACDEALLGATNLPVLRVFRWARPWVSAGFFVPWREACDVRPDLPVCRRWTGGGIVVHDGDFTFSLAIPRSDPWALRRPAESYRDLHRALAKALRKAGIETTLAPQLGAGQSECFAGPVEHDLVAAGRKIAGGAQRRTKRGLIHQGSVQGLNLDAHFGAVLAGCLSRRIEDWNAPEELEGAITILTRGKYDRDEFLRKA